jgi:hypothetical protein
MINISLTEEEAKVLVNMLDVAVKAAGLQAAEAGLHFTKKIQEAQQAAKPAAEEQKEAA